MFNVAIHVQKPLTLLIKISRLMLACTRYNAYCCICMYVPLCVVCYDFFFLVLWSILLVLIFISVFSTSIKSRMIKKIFSHNTLILPCIDHVHKAAILLLCHAGGGNPS